MSLHDDVSAVEIFQGLPSTIIDEIIARGTKMKVGAGRVLAQQGSTDSGLQVILDGTVSVAVNGVERAQLGRGAYFGEISLIDGAPRSATVTAGPDGAQVFAISPIAFSDLLDARPEIARPLLKVLAAHIRRAETPTD